ncbi:MAG: prepilin peptidase [Alphaproteobacteria bacterium]
MTQHDLLSILILIGIAPITGSFLGVLYHRIPAGRNIGLDRSACDDCGHVLSAIDLLPVVTWLATRGRCRHCGVSISAFYPAIEIVALGAVLWAWTEYTGWQVWVTSILGWNLMALILINHTHKSLPGAKILIWPLAALGLAVAWFAAPGTIIDHLIGAVVGFVLGRMFDQSDQKLYGHLGLGSQGAALVCACGAWLSWRGLPDVTVLLLVMTMLASMIKSQGGKGIPGGACLAIGLWLAWLYGPMIQI